MGPELRALLQDGLGTGRLDGAAVGRGRAEHPVCGDEVEVDVILDGDGPDARIGALRWRGSGCPATLAVAALAARDLPGTPCAEAPERLRQGLAGCGDLAPQERHAEAMFVRALQAATAAGREVR